MLRSPGIEVGALDGAQCSAGGGRFGKLRSTELSTGDVTRAGIGPHGGGSHVLRANRNEKLAKEIEPTAKFPTRMAFLSAVKFSSELNVGNHKSKQQHGTKPTDSADHDGRQAALGCLHLEHWWALAQNLQEAESEQEKEGAGCGV
jgi:hypothetical protein